MADGQQPDAQTAPVWRTNTASMAPRGGGGIWQQEMCRLLDWEGPGTRWPRIGKSGPKSASNATQMTAKADKWHPSALDVLMCARVDAPSGAREISHDTAVSVMARNIRTTDNRSPPSSVCAEGLSDNKETSPDIHIIAAQREPPDL